MQVELMLTMRNGKSVAIDANEIKINWSENWKYTKKTTDDALEENLTDVRMLCGFALV